MSREREQFSRIYDEYIARIYRFLYVKVDSKETAEDLASKVFLKGWEAYQKNPAIANMGAFLYKIARNDVANHYRDKSRSRLASSEHLHGLADGRNIHEAAAVNADIETMRSCLKNLKQEYQDVLIWHYLDEMKTPEIAQILQKPEGTVRVMLHRGLKALKSEMVKNV